MTAPVLADALGPRGRRRVLVGSVVTVAVLGSLAAVALSRFADQGQLAGDRWSYFFKPAVLRYLGVGLTNTLRLAAVSMVLATAVGLTLALVRLAQAWPVRMLAVAWLEFFRGVPLILLILFCYLGLPAFGPNLSPFTAATMGLTLYNSAILAEIFRAGILSLERGQREAALAVGLTGSQAMRFVILPQALRRMIPAVVSQLVTLLKDTALAGIITYPDLLARSEIAAKGVRPAAQLQVYLLATAVYVVLNLILSRVARRLEVRQRRRYRAGSIAVAGVEDLTALATTKPPPDV